MPAEASLTETPDLEAAPRLRIDQPHPIAGHEVADDLTGSEDSLIGNERAASPAILTILADQSREQLQLQASQLAGHLRERLREVDRREAALNARVAQLEADLRSSRLWLREKENEFQDREAELQRQIEDLRAASTGDATEAGAATAEELEQRALQLAHRENELRERRFDLERQAAALHHSQQLWQQEQARQEKDLAAERQRLEQQFQQRGIERDERLHELEAILTDHARQLEKDRQELAADQQQWQEKKQRELEALCQRSKDADDRLTDRELRLEARQEWIERQRASLEQVRSEVLNLHRQSLEMRLIAEQLWAQISDRMLPAEVTASIARLRVKLTEHYRDEEKSLEAKRGELLLLSEKISAQHEELTQLRAGLKTWLATRQTEIEEQAARLVTREQELDAEQDRMRLAHEQWQTQRQAYQQQIRELMLRQPDVLAAA